MLLDIVRSVLKLETSSTEADLQELLTGLTVRHLKDLCSKFQVKSSGTKAILFSELVTFWKRQYVKALLDVRCRHIDLGHQDYNRLDEGSVLTSGFHFHACLRLPYS